MGSSTTNTREQELGGLLALSSVVVVEGDLESGRFLAAHGPREAVLGWEDGAAPAWADLVVPDDRRPVLAALDVLRHGRPIAAFEARHRCGGAERRLRWSLEPLADGRFRGLAQVASSDHPYQALVDTLSDGYCVVEVIFVDERPVDYRFVVANAAFALQTGLVNAVGRKALELVPDLEPFWVETYGRVAKTGVPARFENHAPSMGRSFDVHAFRIGAPADRRVGIFFRDVSQQKRAEDRERFLEALDVAVRPLTDPALITTTAAELLGRHLGVERCAYATCSEDEDAFTVVGNYTSGLPGLVGHYRLKDLGAEVLRLMREGKPFVADDVESSTTAGAELTGYRAAGIRAAISVPLHKGGHFVAGMSVHSSRPRHWAPHEVDLVQTVAARSWESIERARVTHDLAESEDELRALAEAVPCIVWVAEPEGFLTYVNAHWTELTGIPAAASRGFGWLDAIHPEDTARVLAHWSSSAASATTADAREPFQSDVRFRTKDGGYRWHLYRAVAVKDRDGTIRRVYGAALDVQNLRDEDQHFREMADTAPSILWLTDPNGACTFLSRSWFDFTGQREADALGFGWLTASDPDDFARVKSIFTAATAKRSPFAFDHRVRRADGVYRWVANAGRPRFGPDGALLGYVGSVIDITERKEAEKGREHVLDAERSARVEAERVGLMKDEFLATLSHELRTPLNAILGWTQLLRTGKVDDAAVPRAIETIERNATVQRHLVEDLLDMNRIISGKVHLELEAVDLGEVAKAALESTRPTAEAKSVRLRLAADAGGNVVLADPARLQQIIWNLLSNAVKFTPRGGEVEVSVKSDPTHAEVRVKDSGRGIEPSFLPHIFERFAQADATTKRSVGGLGLGLAIVKQLAELHNAEVRAESGGAGKGAVFTLRMPLALPKEIENPNGEGDRYAPILLRGSRGPTLEGVKVLVVDDSQDNLDLVAALLESREARVVTSLSAMDGLSLLERERPDILISDIGMPVVDGYDFLRRVRGLGEARGGNVRAIALTAYASDADKGAARRAGFDAHMAKPIDSAALLALVASFATPEAEASPRSA